MNILLFKKGSYNIGGKDGKVSGLDEGDEAIDAIIEVVISKAKCIVLDQVGELKDCRVFKDGIPILSR